MIYVSVGTQRFQMNRLLKTLDKLVADGVIQEEILAQIGESDYEPKHYRFCRFMEPDAFEEAMRRADLLILHSGVATIVKALQMEKRVIVFPRLAKYGEHVDDHQLQIAKNFRRQGFVLVCTDEQKLADMIARARTYTFGKFSSNREHAVSLVRSMLKELEGDKI